jgi:hypothetical protein
LVDSFECMMMYGLANPEQCICSYSSRWSIKEYTFVLYSLEKKITSFLYEGPPQLIIHWPCYRVLLPLASLVRSGIVHLSSPTGLYCRTKCLSCVNDRLEVFVSYLFDPKYYRPCNKKNLHFISHYFPEVCILLVGENRNLLFQPLSLPWSSSSLSSSVDLRP